MQGLNNGHFRIMEIFHTCILIIKHTYDSIKNYYSDLHLPNHLEFKTDVVYFDQRLDAAHSKRWSKYAILTFLMAKSLKSKKFGAKFLLF